MDQHRCGYELHPEPYKEIPRYLTFPCIRDDQARQNRDRASDNISRAILTLNLNLPCHELGGLRQSLAEFLPIGKHGCFDEERARS